MNLCHVAPFSLTHKGIYMNRREFLKVTGISAASLALGTPLAIAENTKAHPRDSNGKFTPSSDYRNFLIKNPIELFTVIPFPDTNWIFPLDVCLKERERTHASVEFAINNENRIIGIGQSYTSNDWIKINVLPISETSNTSIKASEEIYEKIQDLATELLWGASTLGEMFKGTKQELLYKFVKHFRHTKIGLLQHFDYLIGVDLKRCKDYCVMPFCNQLTKSPPMFNVTKTFPKAICWGNEKINKNEYKASTDIGFAVLDETVTIMGKIV